MSDLIFDLRKVKVVELDDSTCLKEDATYQFQDELTGRKLIAKFISHYADEEDEYLIREFKKLISLSGEPEIGTVHFLATGSIKGATRSCYVMNYIEGETLGTFLAKNEKLNHDTVVDIVAQIAAGIEKAHHYEVFHSDLHEENVIIDSMGFVKIIDFAWFDYKMQATFNFKQDLDAFHKIVEALFSKCDLPDSLVKKICLTAENFKGLRQKILQTSELAFDWDKIPEDSKIIISRMIRGWDVKRMYNSLIGENNKAIDAKFIPPLDKNEEKNNSTASSLFPMLDANRRMKIERLLLSKFNETLGPLKQAGLISGWEVAVVGVGATHDGPYYANYRITPSAKFYRWIRKLMGFDFLITGNGKEDIFTLITK